MSTFQYIRPGDGEIRIIELQPGDGNDKIQGSLKLISIKCFKPERYSALSYSWGLDSQPWHSLFLDDMEFKVRRNLFQALQQLRYLDRPRLLWVDAICINQQDEDDVKMQLPLMSSIYSKAEMVEIWLGTSKNNEEPEQNDGEPGQKDGELGLASLASRKLEATATIEVMCAVIDFLQREWFSRLWIIQELILAANNAAFVNCGRVRVTWESFSSGITEILDTNNLNGAFSRRLVPENGQLQGPSPPAATDNQINALKNLFSHVMASHGRSIMHLCDLHGRSIMHLCDLRTSYSQRAVQSKPKPSASVGSVLRQSRHANARVLRDKVSGVCGLLEPLVAKKLIYLHDKSEEELFFATTLHILQHDTHPNLYHEYPTISPREAKESNVPSWTLKFSFTGKTYAEGRFTSFTRFDAAKKPHDKLNFSSDGRQMTVDVCVIDTITRVLEPDTNPLAPNNADLWEAFTIRFYEEAAKRMEKLTGKPAKEHTKTPQPMNWQEKVVVERTAESVNLIGFLKQAHDLYQQHLKTLKGTDMTTSFWETILSGLHDDYGKGTGMELPIDSRLNDQGAFILVDRDSDGITPDLDPFAHVTVQAFDPPLKEAATVMAIRAHRSPALYGALKQVLAPAGCNARSGFYVTENGLCGLCLPGAEKGDVIARVFRGTGFDIPIVLRREEKNKYSMVCVASVSKGWEEVCIARGAVDPEEVVLV